ncbi:MAG: efflux RND transporter permease subunit, partial [Spirochaetia bacterium]|nr:efflux RND transporter permease subunit [Spirochaetia bacterium]
MLEKVILFSLKHKYYVLAAAAGLLILGIFFAFRLPIDAVPDITNVQVQINTSVPALSPEEIERLVTFPIETEMAGLPGAVEVRSLSKFGLSQVNVVFREGQDLYRARQLALERLLGAVENIPPGLAPKLAPISTGLGEIYYYVLDYKKNVTNLPPSREAQLMELKALQDFVVKPRLRSVEGVAEVNTSGGYEKQIVIMPAVEKLRATGVSLQDIAKAVGENVRNAGGGAVELGGERITVRSVGRVENTTDVGQIPIRFRAGGEAIRVRDLAEVAVGSGIRTGASTHNGREAVVGSALMLAGENSRVVAVRVHEKIKEIGAVLPENVELITVYN